MSHLKSLIIPYDINKTCVRHLETLPHEAMNLTKGVLFASSSEITTLGSFAAQVSVHGMKRTQNDMKTSSLEAKRHRRLTEKHTDWKRDFDKILWQVQTHGKHEAACSPRQDTCRFLPLLLWTATEKTQSPRFLYVSQRHVQRATD